MLTLLDSVMDSSIKNGILTFNNINVLKMVSDKDVYYFAS